MSEHLGSLNFGYHEAVATKRKRTYVKAARAESEAATRDRIVEALVELHQEVGPARTTVKAVAERARVQRLTVYRHFPRAAEMFAACSARWNERQPLPDFSRFTGLEPRPRARAMLVALYAYYRGGAPMLSRVLADAPHVAELREQLAPFRELLEELVAELERGWRGRSRRRHATLQHAVQFSTWQSLATLAASDGEAADLVLRWCDGV